MYEGNDYDAPVPARPQHPGALSQEDIQPGMLIHRHYRGEGRQTMLVLELPRETSDGLQVRLISQVDPVSAEELAELAARPIQNGEMHFLSDLGVVPYQGGDGPVWSSTNYITAVE